jgi:hypothetical protein
MEWRVGTVSSRSHYSVLHSIVILICWTQFLKMAKPLALRCSQDSFASMHDELMKEILYAAVALRSFRKFPFLAAVAAKPIS